MPPRLHLHRLSGEKRAGVLVRLLESLLRERRRVVVWIEDDGRRQILDDYLWTFEKLAFVPHLLWSPGLGEVDDPLVLVGEPVNPNRAEILVVGDSLPPDQWSATFAEVHDLLPAGAEGDQREAHWRRRRDGAG